MSAAPLRVFLLRTAEVTVEMPSERRERRPWALQHKAPLHVLHGSQASVRDAERTDVGGEDRRMTCRMRADGLVAAIGDGDDDARATPQNVEESARFFADGGRVLWRDVRRGRVFANGDTPACYAWFALLSFSTFPLTPLLLPVIDVRRRGGGGRRCDYVPSCFRARRLAAFSRLKSRPSE